MSNTRPSNTNPKDTQIAAAKHLALAAVDAALSKGALEPTLIDVSSAASYTDYILIVSATNPRQGAAIAEVVEQRLKGGGDEPIGIEGDSDSQWRLLDYGDVIIHIFFHPVRSYYDLESLWSEAKRVPLNVPPEQRAVNDYY